MVSTVAWDANCRLHINLHIWGLQGELSQFFESGGAEVIHVEADLSEDVPEGSADVTHSITIDPAEEEAATVTDNPIFVQNVWELPPTRGFYLEDIMEEGTADLVGQSGYVIGPSGLIVNSTLESLPRSNGDSHSPPKKLPTSEQSAQHQRRNSFSSLHQSVQSNTQHSLHDSLSDG